MLFVCLFVSGLIGLDGWIVGCLAGCEVGRRWEEGKLAFGCCYQLGASLQIAGAIPVNQREVFKRETYTLLLLK